MTLTINDCSVNVIADLRYTPGTKFTPQMTLYLNDADWAPFTKQCSMEVSAKDHGLVASVIGRYMTDAIVEIGVGGIHRPLEGSFTQLLIDTKPIEIPYLGIDCENKDYLKNPEANVYTIQAFSDEQMRIRKYMKEIGIKKISILFIDGNHSVNSVINDWLYTDLLSDNGIVIFHDTNYHPGPAVFTHCIDESIYKVEKHFENMDDYGVAIVTKRG